MDLNPAQIELQTYLRTMVDARQRLLPGIPQGYRYSCMEDYLLTHGTWHTPRPLRRLKYLLPKNCFGNSTLTSLRQHKDRLFYAEGIALGTIIPVHHAWNVDKDGNVVDTTWEPVGTAYLGCIFKPRDVNRLLAKGCTMLDNYKDGHPLFKEA